MIAPIFVGFLALLVGLPERSSASPSLVEIYKSQEQERIRVSGICRGQYQQAQYHQYNDELTGGPYREESTEDSPIYRFMVSDKGVQAISPYAIAQANGKFKCKRGEHELTKALGKTYASSHTGICNTRTKTCTTYVVKTRLEIEPCLDEGVEKLCLFAYYRGLSSLVEREVLGIGPIRRVER